MSKVLYVCVILGGLCVVSGCSDDGKKSEPKLADPSKVDPRLKPAEAGSGGTPQENKAKGAVKGD